VNWFLFLGYRSGIAYTRAHRIEEGLPATLLKSTILALVRLARGAGYLAIGAITMSKARLVNGLFRMASGCGTLGGLIGASHNEYEVIHGD